MKIYHAEFTGKQKSDHGDKLKKIQVLMAANSIHDVMPLIRERYDFVSGGHCVTDCAAIGREFFEISSVEL